MDINEWFQTITNGESQRTVAQKINVQQSKLSRQLNAGHLDPELIRDIARAYDATAVDELIATGFLTPDDATLVGVELALGIAKNSQILSELEKRTDPEARRVYRAEALPGVVDIADDAQVFEFPATSIDEMGDDWMPEDAVADDSPEEGEGMPDDYLP